MHVSNNGWVYEPRYPSSWSKILCLQSHPKQMHEFLNQDILVHDLKYLVCKIGKIVANNSTSLWDDIPSL